MTVPTDPAPPTTTRRHRLARRAPRRAASACACWSAASVVEAILDRNIDSLQRQRVDLPAVRRDPGRLRARRVGWPGGSCPTACLTNGALAGVGAFVLWIPVRIVIWVVRDENRGLFSGHSPALRPGQIVRPPRDRRRARHARRLPRRPSPSRAAPRRLTPPHRASFSRLATCRVSRRRRLVGAASRPGGRGSA